MRNTRISRRETAIFRSFRQVGHDCLFFPDFRTACNVSSMESTESSAKNHNSSTY
ncbi:hypothetical protein BIFANG_02182 [Bifidobacterium angulatum DSM 20098 = JCM 7096]|uniref:Uncharacterized protein n=1 Tax=Bifidobacterium angulatum DSM 20098 = JCM 7096 TaxID=518635 RepID=C4FD03_9BIFI|nr:hypothetical protein BIFANG_02182 [Bifidobacterium angulatum DSM 20098 = JCM 7096]